jgi:hypothetical protein
VGSPLTATIPAGGWKQLNRVFKTAGAGTVDLGYAKIETNDGKIWAYGSVVDNTSGDGTTIPLTIAGATKYIAYEENTKPSQDSALR